MRQRFSVVVTLVLATIAASCEPAGSNSIPPPTKAGEFSVAVPEDSWKKCQERVRSDLKYDPQRAEFTLKSSLLQAVETGEFAKESYGSLLWRFDAEVLASNAFGTLVRKDLRCYIAFDKAIPAGERKPTGTVLFEIVEPGEKPLMWEKG